MSYIDCYDHEFLGWLAYLPLYHPLVTCPRESRGSQDFGFDPGNIVLGGGGGEHPAIVVHRVDAVVAKFLATQLTEKDEEVLSRKAIDELYDRAAVPLDACLEFCGWRMRQHAEFAEAAQSRALNRPVRSGEAIEDWICWSVGEFVFYACPDLCPTHAELVALVKEHVAPIFRNVWCTPPGYPLVAGRRTVEGRLQWGLHRFQPA